MTGNWGGGKGDEKGDDYTQMAGNLGGGVRRRGMVRPKWQGIGEGGWEGGWLYANGRELGGEEKGDGYTQMTGNWVGEGGGEEKGYGYTQMAGNWVGEGGWGEGGWLYPNGREFGLQGGGGGRRRMVISKWQGIGGEGGRRRGNGYTQMAGNFVRGWGGGQVYSTGGSCTITKILHGLFYFNKWCMSSIQISSN